MALGWSIRPAATLGRFLTWWARYAAVLYSRLQHSRQQGIAFFTAEADIGSVGSTI